MSCKADVPNNFGPASGGLDSEKGWEALQQLSPATYGLCSFVHSEALLSAPKGCSCLGFVGLDRPTLHAAVHGACCPLRLAPALQHLLPQHPASMFEHDTVLHAHNCNTTTHATTTCAGRDALVHGSARPGAVSQRCFNPEDKVTEEEGELLLWSQASMALAPSTLVHEEPAHHLTSLPDLFSGLVTTMSPPSDAPDRPSFPPMHAQLSSGRSS